MEAGLVELVKSIPERPEAVPEVHSSINGDVSGLAHSIKVRSTSEALLHVGNEASTGQLDAAFAEARRKLELDPENPWLAANLASAYLSRNRPANSLNVLERFSVMQPGLERLGVLYLRSLAAAGRWKEAKSSFERLVADSESNWRLSLEFARSATIAGDLQAAASEYERLRLSLPQRADIHAEAGVVFALQSDSRRAINSFRHATRVEPHLASAFYNLANCQQKLGQLTKAAANASTATRLVPSYAAAHLSFIRSLISDDRLGDARSAATKVLSTSGSSAEILDLLGEIAYRQKDFKACALFLLRATSSFGSEAPRLNNAGIALFETGRHNQAENLLVEAIQIDPSDFHAYLNLAIGLTRGGHYQKAESTLRSGLAIAKSENMLRPMLASVLTFQERPKEAFAEVEKMIASENPPQESFIIGGSLLSDSLNDLPGAIALLTHGLDRFPDNQKIGNNLAYSLLTLGDMERANSVLSKFSQHVHVNPFLSATRGWYRLLKGDLEGGRALYKNAISRFRDRTLKKRAKQKLELELGRALLRRGDAVKAESHLRAAIRLNADPLFSADSRRLLVSLEP